MVDVRGICAIACIVTGCSFRSGAISVGVAGDAAADAVIHAVDDVRLTDASKKPADAMLDAMEVPPTFVQGKASAAATNVHSVSITLPDPEVAGDLNLVAMYLTAGASLPTVTDLDNNTYSQVGSAVSTTDPGLLAVYVAADVAAGSANTITATFTGNESAGMAVVAYRGVAAASPIDITVAATGTGSGVDSGTATTTNARDLLVGLDYVQTAVTAAGTGFVTRTSQNGNTIEDMFVTSVGTYDASATQSSGGYAMRLIALRSAQ
jgi:hypothetical protein